MARLLSKFVRFAPIAVLGLVLTMATARSANAQFYGYPGTAYGGLGYGGFGYGGIGGIGYAGYGGFGYGGIGYGGPGYGGFGYGGGYGGFGYGGGYGGYGGAGYANYGVGGYGYGYPFYPPGFAGYQALSTGLTPLAVQSAISENVLLNGGGLPYGYSRRRPVVTRPDYGTYPMTYSAGRR